jgi:hypothetical protein
VEELGAVGVLGGAEAVEHLDRQAARVLVGLHHDRRHRADQHDLAHAAGLGAGGVVDRFAAAGRVADVDGVLQVQVVGQGDDVGGVGVHLVAGVGLARAAVAATVMGDDPETLAQEEHHLVVPVVRAQRPTVVEHDRLGGLGTPVLVEDLGAVLGGDEAAAHGRVSWFGRGLGRRRGRC